MTNSAREFASKIHWLSQTHGVERIDELVAENDAELKAQCAAVMHQAVQIVRENQSRHESNELNWPETFNQIEHELCAIIPSDWSAALQERDPKALKDLQIDWSDMSSGNSGKGTPLSGEHK